jgi:pyridoxamine 5'-phosphate oxidase
MPSFNNYYLCFMAINEYIKSLRTNYSKHSLDEKEVNADPLRQFELWMKEAIEAKVNEPHAMVVSTVDKNGKPSSRILLLREVSDKGFSFYTNYHSRKGSDIEQNPFVCLNFFWPELERQVRVEGKLSKQTDRESDEYFETRPRESQLGAWVSTQSHVLKSREELERKFAETEQKFSGKPIPRPPYWGGYNLKPERLEFWQGRPHRLHDRIQYTINMDSWKIERLFP